MCTCSPVWDIFALWWEFEDPGIAVSVWDEDVSSKRVHGHICRLAEMILVTSWFESFSQDQKLLICAATAQLQYLDMGKECFNRTNFIIVQEVIFLILLDHYDVFFYYVFVSHNHYISFAILINLFTSSDICLIFVDLAWNRILTI